MIRKLRAFTLIELLVVISIIALLIGILLPALGAARRTARQMQNSTQIRGIIQGCILFAQGNNDYYPGMKSDGSGAVNSSISASGTTAASKVYGSAANTTDVNGFGDQPNYRVAALLNGSYFPPEYIISPSETATPPAKLNAGDIVLAPKATQMGHYSYAFLGIGGDPNATPTACANRSTDNGGRNQEWKATTNSQAVAISDRARSRINTPPAQCTNAMKTNGSDDISISIHNTTDMVPADDKAENAAKWRGTVGWNDDHCTFETTSIMPTSKFGSPVTNDALFSSDSMSLTNVPTPWVRGANAWMCYR